MSKLNNYFDFIQKEMNFFPFFIFKLLFILQFLLNQILAENEFLINFQIIANDLVKQPPSAGRAGRFQLSLEEFNEETKKWKDFGGSTDSKDSFYIKLMPPMKFYYRVIIMADGRKTKFKQFEITEMTSPIYSIILEDAPLSGGIDAQKYEIDSQIYNKKITFSANIYPGIYSDDTLPIIDYLTQDQKDLIKQKIPESLHSLGFSKLKKTKNSFMFPQINIRRQENEYNIDICEGKQIQRIEKKQPISLPFAQINVPMLPPPLENFALEINRNPAAKKGKTMLHRIPLPPSPLKPRKLEKSPEPPIDLDFLVTPPMSPTNSGEENMTMTNLDIPLNTINLNTLSTTPISENSPTNSDISMDIENDKARRLLLAKGKRPMENVEAGTSKIRINGRNLKFVEFDKIYKAPKRKIAEIYENGNSEPKIPTNNNFDRENLKWGKQQKRGSNWEKIRNKLGNLGIDSGNGKSHHQKPEKILYVENEPKSPMNIDEEEEEGIGHKSGMKKFVKSLLRAHQVEMKNNIKDGGIFNSKVHHYNGLNISGFDDDLIYFHDDKKSSKL